MLLLKGSCGEIIRIVATDPDIIDEGKLQYFLYSGKHLRLYLFAPVHCIF